MTNVQRAIGWTGYDFNQDAANRNPNKSAKYALKDITDRLRAQGIADPASHEDAEQYAKTYLVPEYEKLGYKVWGVDRDKFNIGTRENPDGELIDWLVGAGGADPKFGWQSNYQGPNTSASTWRMPTRDVYTSTQKAIVPQQQAAVDPMQQLLDMFLSGQLI